MKRKNGKQNKLLKFLALVFLYLGVGMLCLPLIRNIYWMERITHQVITEVDSLQALDVIPNQQITPPTLREVFTGTTTGKSIGRLAIPSLALNLPVFAGLDQEEMINGAGTMYPQRDPRTNNLVLVGHHTGSTSILFGRLAEIQKEEPIYLRYLGDPLAYQVDSIKVVKASEVAVAAETKQPRLTLVTCDRVTPTNDRIVVTAKQIRETNKKSIAQKIRHQQLVSKEKSGWRQEWPAISLVLTGLLALTYLIIKKI